MLKENKKQLFNFLIVFILQVLALVYKPFVFVELVFLIICIAVDKVKNKICYLFFMLPFYNVFRYYAGYISYNNILDGSKSLYLSILLLLSFCVVMLIRYLIDIRHKKKIFNWKNLLIWLGLYIILLIPINKITFSALSSFLTISSLFASLYLIVQYKEEFQLKKILDVWLLAVIFSLLLYPFKDILPYLSDFIVSFENRFACLSRDPNYFAFELMVLLFGYTILFFSNEIKKQFILPFVLVTIFGFLSVSKSFLICYSVYLVICLIYFIRFLTTKVASKKQKILVVSICCLIIVIAAVFVCLIILPKLFSNRDNVLLTDDISIYGVINAVTTGRFDIWMKYLQLIFSSFTCFVFGYGFLNGYPYEAIHNTPIQILFFGGLIGFVCILILTIILLKKERKPIWFYLYISVILLFSCGLDLLFSYRTYLILAIMILCFNKSGRNDMRLSQNLGGIMTTKENQDYLISIIVPVYKVEKYLDRCLNSLVKQAYQNLEIILVDDGSPDNCPKMCDNWSKKDNRIKVIHKENGGVSSARNTGIECATGDYITFLDSDDYYSETFSNCLSFLNGDNIYCFSYNSDQNGLVKKIQPNIAWNEGLNHDFNKGKISTVIYNSVWNKIFKTAFLKENNIIFDTGFVIAEDLKFVLDCFVNDEKMNFINAAYYNYYQNSESVIHNVTFKKINDTLQVCEYAIKSLKNFKDKKTKTFIKKLISENLLTVLNRANSYTLEENNFIKSELKKHKKYICYGSTFIKKIIVALTKVFGVSFAAKCVKVIRG